MNGTTFFRGLQPPSPSWRTLVAEGWEWRHGSRSLAALNRLRPQVTEADTRSFRPPEVDQEPAARSHKWRLWLTNDERVRAEYSIGEDRVTCVVAGSTWWSWSAALGRTNENDPSVSHGIGPGAVLLDPSKLLAASDLTTLGQVSFGGRSAWSVRAVPTIGEVGGTHILNGRDESLRLGADEYLLMVDAERGMLLRSEARLAGKPFHVVGIHRVQFDENLPDELFAPPTGVVFDLVQTPRDLSQHDLAASVSFDVLFPPHSPVSFEHASLHAAEGRMPEHLHIVFDGMDSSHLRERTFSIVESALPLPERKNTEWREVDDAMAGIDYGVDPPVRIVRLTRNCTYVELRSVDFSDDELLVLARSLVNLSVA